MDFNLLINIVRHFRKTGHQRLCFSKSFIIESRYKSFSMIAYHASLLSIIYHKFLTKVIFR